MTKTTAVDPAPTPPPSAPGTPDRPRPRPNSRQGRLVERQRHRRRQRRIAIGAVVAVVVIVAGLIVVKVTSGGSGTPVATGPVVTVPAPPAVLATLAAVPVSTMVSAAAGAGVRGPSAVAGAPLTSGGKPEVLYIGAEYCPYCAATRWPMVMALLKFGTFSGLGTTHSASGDVDPNTATFSFHGATYTSAYLSFAGVETTTNQRQGNSYVPLDTPTAAQQQVWTTAAPGGSIPFIDFGGQSVIVGTSYDPGVLSGLSVTAIAQRIAAGSGTVAKNIDAVAGLFTAQLCRMTGDQPANVCSAFTS